MENNIVVIIFNVDHFTGCTYYSEKRFKNKLIAHLYCVFKKNAYIYEEGQVIKVGLYDFNKRRKTMY